MSLVGAARRSLTAPILFNNSVRVTIWSWQPHWAQTQVPKRSGLPSWQLIAAVDLGCVTMIFSRLFSSASPLPLAESQHLSWHPCSAHCHETWPKWSSELISPGKQKTREEISWAAQNENTHRQGRILFDLLLLKVLLFFLVLSFLFPSEFVRYASFIL